MNKVRPTKAIIPVAGFGSRRLPITKSIEKCMLPFLNRPLVDYIVEDCRQAGITDIIFVVSGRAPQLKGFYAPNEDLNEYLLKKNKKLELAELDAIGRGLKFHFVEQSRDVYGTAVPIWQVRELLTDNEPFVVLMGDDIILRHDGMSSVDALINYWLRSDSEHALLGVDVPAREVSKYGVLQVSDAGTLECIVEKPSEADAPSTMINVSKYIFSSSIMGPMGAYMGKPRKGEYMITDVVDDAIKEGESCQVVPARGVYLDGGTVEGWLHANNYLASIQLKD